MNDTLSPTEPLTPEERDRALDEITARIRRHGLETPALFFLEMHRPLAGLASMASFVVTPLFGAFLGLDKVERYASMIGDPDALDALVERLDSVRDEKRAGVKAAKTESGA
jgi:hypothetical protein